MFTNHTAVTRLLKTLAENGTNKHTAKLAPRYAGRMGKKRNVKGFDEPVAAPTHPIRGIVRGG